MSNDEALPRITAARTPLRDLLARGNPLTSFATASATESAPLHRLKSSASLLDLGVSSANARLESPWSRKYREEARRELVDLDVDPMLQRFENIDIYKKPRRHLSTMLIGPYRSDTPSIDQDVDDEEEQQDNDAHGNTSGPTGDAALRMQFRKIGKVGTIGRQSSGLSLKSDRVTTARKGKSSKTPRKMSLSPVRIVPTRVLYDATRWPQSSRCDYCNCAGGDLECGTCNVVAHAQCYLASYEFTANKSKGSFVVPTRFSWMCQQCQSSLQQEYDERSKLARFQHITFQQSIFGKVLTAYIRMSKDAMLFKKKKLSVVKIQAAMRGKLARNHYNRLQRQRLKPYTIDGLKLRGFNFRRTIGIEGSGTFKESVITAGEDLRLANGFSCNPYVYVSVVNGNDDETQFFGFETSLRKGVSLVESEVAWPEKLFVPGVDGSVTFCFTLLSKNGPNNFFLGQALLRLKDSDVFWRKGINADLPLIGELDIFPKTNQHQLLRIAEMAAKSLGPGVPESYFANGGSSTMTLSVQMRPYSEVHSYCGYMNMKPSLDSFQASSRWCVLADGFLRVYRHYGVTLASEVLDMARTMEIKVVDAKMGHRADACIAIQHMNRLYLFQCEQKAAHRVWIKKLQAAMKFSQTPSSAASALAANVGGGGGSTGATSRGGTESSIVGAKS